MAVPPLHAGGSLTPAAIHLLHAVSGVDTALLGEARIRPARRNWLRAPWYRYHRGGAITVGRTIWFTGIWFDPAFLGDGSLRSTWKWMLHLAHEVGHLPQAKRFGTGILGKARYVAAFAWQYGSRAVLMRTPVHDGSPLEREADLGRQVLLTLIGPQEERHPAIGAVHRGDTAAVQQWCDANRTGIEAAMAAHRQTLLTE